MFEQNTGNLEEVRRPEDDELMGFICQSPKNDDLWCPLTVFLYPLADPMPKGVAAEYLLRNGLEVLMDTWKFYDSKDDEWYNCIIIEAKPDHLVIKISDYGHPNVHSTLTVRHPVEKIRR